MSAWFIVYPAPPIVSTKRWTPFLNRHKPLIYDIRWYRLLLRNNSTSIIIWHTYKFTNIPAVQYSTRYVLHFSTSLKSEFGGRGWWNFQSIKPGKCYSFSQLSTNTHVDRSLLHTLFTYHPRTQGLSKILGTECMFVENQHFCAVLYLLFWKQEAHCHRTYLDFCRFEGYA